MPIQSDGTFNAEICFWCPEDFPDLYFEVIQNLDGVETEIYDPQIACSTFYDYDGSESVDIVIDDPRAVACQHLISQCPAVTTGGLRASVRGSAKLRKVPIEFVLNLQKAPWTTLHT